MHSFSTYWKHQKTLRFSEFFKRLRNGALGPNGLTWHYWYHFTFRINVTSLEHLVCYLLMHQSLSYNQPADSLLYPIFRHLANMCYISSHVWSVMYLIFGILGSEHFCCKILAIKCFTPAPSPRAIASEVSRLFVTWLSFFDCHANETAFPFSCRSVTCKIFKNGPNKIYEIQPSKNLK